MEVVSANIPQALPIGGAAKDPAKKLCRNLKKLLDKGNML